MGHIQGKGAVCGTFHDGSVQIVPRGLSVHFTQTEALRKYAKEGLVQFLFLEKAAFHGLLESGEAVAAFYVESVFHGCGSGFRLGGAVVVAARLIEVGDGPAVRHHKAFVAPFLAEDVLHQVLGSGAGNATETVVGGHHFLHAGLGYQVLEGGQVGFTEVTLRNLGVEAVTVALQTGVHGIVLGAGVGLEHVGIGVSLQAADHGHAQLTGEVRVFTVGLHAPAPARVAENVDVRSPEGKALILPYFSAFHGQTVLHAGLVRDGGEHFLYLFPVKGRGHADRLGKHGGGAVAGHPVQGLAPPVVLFDTQTLNRGRVEKYQRSFFLQREFGQQVLGTDLCREGFVLIGNLFWGRTGRKNCHTGSSQR